MMLMHIIDFVVDYFTNINAKKILGGILVFIGLALLNRVVSSGLKSGNFSIGLLYALGGFLIGSIGLVVIYYDITNDKLGRNFDELRTFTEAYKQKGSAKSEISVWNMDQETKDKNPSDKTP